jgi:hypothetical protein
MKPVDQTIGEPPNGNCAQACVASILELELDKVPNFMCKGPEEYCDRIADYLQDIGFTFVEFNLHNGHVWHGVWRHHIYGYWLATLPSKNIPDAYHMIVMRGSELAHDPAMKNKYTNEEIQENYDSIKYMKLLVPNYPEACLNG